MSYDQGGVIPKYPTKKALREAAEAGVPFQLHSTSMFGGFSGRVDDLPESLTFNVVGPDPYNSRKWYASVSRDASGKVRVK